MTLAGRLLAGISAAFALMLVGMAVILVQNSRQYLQQQLETHAQEAATSIAVALGGAADASDAAFAATVIGPVFDRGRFRSIRIITPRDEVLAERELAAEPDDAPAWFRRLLPLEAPIGEALVQRDWRQLGRVIVQIHPYYAYRQLWSTLWATLAWLGILYLVVLMAMRRFLARILRPLSDIERLTAAIGRREFDAPRVNVSDPELQRVADAINGLATSVRAAIEAEIARADRAHRAANEDALTGTLNRAGFDRALAARLAEGGDISSGALGLFALTGLDQVNNAGDASVGDALLREFAQRIGGELHGRAPLVGRWFGATFAAFVANEPRAAAEAWARAVCRKATGRVHEQGLPAAPVGVVAGVATFDAARPAPDVLERSAEHALVLARERGPGACEVLDIAEDTLSGSPEALRVQIQQALDEGALILYGQRVFSLPERRAIQLEAMSRLMIGTEEVVAAAFVPAASRAHLVPRIDRLALEQLHARCASRQGLPERLALNVSLQSVVDADYRAALEALAQRDGVFFARLVFEIHTQAAAGDAEIVADFARVVGKHGARIGLDGFEPTGAALRILPVLLPEYVKLAPEVTRSVHDAPGARFLVEALLGVVRPLGILVIAQGVEDDAQLEPLAALGVHGFQGYAGERPARLA